MENRIAQPLVIEFAGHAGSGKSFLRERLVADLDGVFDISANGDLGIRDVVVFFLRHPVTAFLILRLVWHARPRTVGLARKAFLKFLVYQLKMKRAERAGAPLVVCCEGMLHRFRMLKSNSRRADLAYPDLPRAVRRNLFHKADLVVFVTASLETTSARRVARDEEARMEGLEAMVARKKDSFAGSLARTEADIRSAQEEHRFHYLQIVNETDSPIEENLKKIRTELALLCRNKMSVPSPLSQPQIATQK